MIRLRALGPLALAVALIAGCGVAGGPAEPPCVEDGSARFGSDAPVPVCGVSIDLDAAGGKPMGRVLGHLPPNGPYGSGQKRAVLSFALHDIGSGEEFAVLSIDADPGNYGLGGKSLDASGDCTVPALRPRLLLECDVTPIDGSPLPLRLDLPPVPDPATDPGIAWLEVQYRFEGQYEAAATVRSAVTASADHTYNLGIALEDGGLVVMVPRAEDPLQIGFLRLPAPDGVATVAEPWLPETETPSLGTCRVTFDERAENGSLECDSGATTLEMTWRRLP